MTEQSINLDEGFVNNPVLTKVGESGRPPLNQVAMTGSERVRRCRAKNARLRSIHTTNASAVAAAAALYIRDGATVVDATYGLGQFWRKKNPARFFLVGSDIASKATIRADFRQLPFAAEAVDVIVLDPPYTWNRHPRMTNHDRFGGVTAPVSIEDVLELYRVGMVEAARVLKPRGRLFVKAMDQLTNHRQHWFSLKLPQIAENLGMFMRDQFIVKANKTPSYPQWERQHHAWKTHSFLLIFERSR